jgi:hypothetical protein
MWCQGLHNQCSAGVNAPYRIDYFWCCHPMSERCTSVALEIVRLPAHIDVSHKKSLIKHDTWSAVRGVGIFAINFKIVCSLTHFSLCLACSLPLKVFELNIQYFQNNFLKLTWRDLYHVFTYIYSLLIKKDICDCWNISIKLQCVCMCLSSRNLFILSVRVSSFFSYFLWNTWKVRLN